MGVVYRATDPRLDRDVAIKALPPELASDPPRLERFEREAKTLAQLNHPNLAGIHGLEQHDGAQYLVLEFVEGATLADRLDRGPLPPDEAIELAAQIADGVAAAHDAGIVHRDLKPANIIITPDGKVKVLDFGLARADEGQTSTGSSEAVTLTTPVQHSPTMPGVILGTAAYMSPEQARGRRVDKRTDIWSFGVVFYEMLTGASPFVGETATDSIGAILHKDLDLEALPRDCPRAARRVLDRCLRRDRNERYRDIGDARLDLLGPDTGPGPELQKGGRSRGPVWTGTAIGAAGLAVAAIVLLQHSPKESTGSNAGSDQRFEADLVTGPGIDLARVESPPAISPDSRKVAYLVYNENENITRLAYRDLVTGEETVLRGPDDPFSPAWSPDGRSLFYLSQGRIESIDTSGGRPKVHGRSGVFSYNVSPGGMTPDGRYAFSWTRGFLRLIDPETGEIEESIDPFPDRESDWVVAPSFLPDGEHVIFTNQDDVTADSGLYLGSLTENWCKRLLPVEASGVFLEPNLVLYWWDGDLTLQRLDLEARQLVGEPTRVAESVLRRPWPSFGVFDATRDLLVYVQELSNTEDDGLFVLDLETGIERPLPVRGSLWSPQVSPDGRFIALDRTVDATAGDIVTIELETGIETMLSRDEENESLPTWSSDGRRLYFFRGPSLYSVASDGRTPPRSELESSEIILPTQISPDGRWLLLTRSENEPNIFAMDLENRAMREIAAEPDEVEWSGGFVADGNWVAYTTDALGEERVFAKPFDGTGEPVPISDGIGRWVKTTDDWIYYHTRDSLVRRRVHVSDGKLTAGELERIDNLHGLRSYAPFPDGNSVLLIKSLQPTRGGSMRIIRNWLPEEFREP